MAPIVTDSPRRTATRLYCATNSTPGPYREFLNTGSSVMGPSLGHTRGTRKSEVALLQVAGALFANRPRSAWKRHDVLGTAALALTCVLLVSGLAEGELPSFSIAVYFAVLLTLISLPRSQESSRGPVRDSLPVGPRSPAASECLPQSASNHPTPRLAAVTADPWPQAEPRTCNSPGQGWTREPIGKQATADSAAPNAPVDRIRRVGLPASSMIAAS